MSTKSYPVIRLCKDDLEELFKSDKKALEKIKKLDEAEMKYLAEKVQDSLMDLGYWDTLKLTFEFRFLEKAF